MLSIHTQLPYWNYTGDDELPSSWSADLKRVTTNSFTSRTGPTVSIPDSPQECFELFFSEDLQQKVVEETNRYARQTMGEDRYRTWRKITVDKLKAFFGFSILMGIDHLPSVDDYWSKRPPTVVAIQGNLYRVLHSSLRFRKSHGTCLRYTWRLARRETRARLGKVVHSLTISVTSLQQRTNLPSMLLWTRQW